MIRKFLLAVLLIACASSAYARGHWYGYAQQGGASISTAGFSSLTTAQRTFPGSTVTVFKAGTVTTATIYSTSAGAALANPFTSASDGVFSFYSDEASVDITFSGTGITTGCGGAGQLPCISAFTWPDQKATTSGSSIVGNVLDYGADPTGAADSLAAFNACLAANTECDVPAAPSAFYRMSGTLNVKGKILRGVGTGVPTLRFFGAFDGITVDPGGVSGAADSTAIERLQLFSLTAGGVVDPKTQKGIYIKGVAGVHVNGVSIRDVAVRGWLDGIYAAYMWQSTIQDCNSSNSVNGVHVLGQSANNVMKGNFWVVDGSATASGNCPSSTGICFDNDGLAPEGWMVTGGLISGARTGVYQNLQTIGNRYSDLIIDNIVGTGYGFNLTNPADTGISNCWINVLGAGVGINIAGQGVAADVGIIITGNFILTGSGKGIYWGSNNRGGVFSGNYISSSSPAIHFDTGSLASIAVGNYLQNGGCLMTGQDSVCAFNAGAGSSATFGGALFNSTLNNIGSTGGRQVWGMFAGAPNTGTWAAGDISWVTAPASGAAPCYVCTVAGTPGTWKACANLQ